MKVCFLLCAVFSIIAVISIFVFLFLRGVPALSKIGVFKFIFGKSWNPLNSDSMDKPLEGFYGILPMIAGSLYATAGALVIGGGLGIFTAVFLAKFCPKRLKKPLTQIINLLAGLPSIIYGFFGMIVLVPFLGKFSSNGSGSGLLAVSLVLGIMILPTVVALSKTSIEAVDNSYYEGAVALGATHEQAVFKVMVPAAKSGIFASVILGTGRAIGETMAVVMISGGNTVFPTGLFGSFRTVTANIVMEMSYASPFHMTALIANGCALFVFIMIINLCFALIKRDKKTKGGKRGKQRRGKAIKETAGLTITENKRLKTFRQYSAKAGKFFSYLTAAAGTLSLVAIVLFILIKGLPHITGQLLFGKFTFSGPRTILPAVTATLMAVALTSVIAFPLGIFTAIYLAEYTKKGSRTVKLIRFCVETLGGIPSIVYGLFGMVLFCGIFKMGASILAGSLTLSIMIIPVTVRATEESLKSVPDSYREGSFALGCGKLRTIYKIIIPSALPGILSAVILGIGKIVSESAPFLFTTGASMKAMPKGFKSAGTTLAVAVYALAREGKYVNEAYAAACVLIFLVLILNIAATWLAGRLQKKLSGKKS